jgi:hypothetical protein
VGLVWAGNPDHFRDPQRSLPLGLMAGLNDPRIEFIALQKGPAEVQMEALPDFPIRRIAQDFGDTQPNMATQAANRAMLLREGLRNPGMRISPPERPCLTMLPAPTGNTIQLAPPVMPASTPVPGQLMSSSGSSSGILRRSGRSVDDRRAYILERDNRIIGYVVPVPTLNLEPFLNQPVILIGTTEYRGEVRANVVHASTVTLGR